MANVQVLEGSWEELKLRDKELSGIRICLILLSSEPKSTTSKASKVQKEAAQELGATVPRELTGMRQKQE